MRKLITVAMGVAALGAPLGAQENGQETVEVPLRMENGRFLVPVVASDGTEMEFAITTGNPMTILSASTAERLGDHPALSMAGVEVSTEGLHVLPDEQLTSHGKVLAGMIGGETLNRFDILVDAPGGRLLLKPVGRTVEWEGFSLSAPIPLRVLHGVVISLDVEVNGKEVPAQLDLGTPLVIVNDGLGDLVGGEAQASLRVGSSAAMDVPVEVRDLPVFARWDPDGNGFALVGSPIARECAISISWVHQEMRTCVQ